MRRGSAGMSVGVVVALAGLIIIYSKHHKSGMGEPTEIELAIAALSEDGPDQAREEAHDLLLEAGELSVDSLLSALADPETGRPEEVIRALARIGDPRAVTPLRQTAAGHPDALTRRTAVQALAEFDDRESIDLLRDLAGSDPALQVRQAAVVGMADMGDDSVLTDLAAMLDERTVAELRESAGASLEVLTGQDFGLDRAAAEAWLVGQGGLNATTSVGGWHLEEGDTLRVAGTTSVEIERTGPDLEITLSGRVQPPMNLLLDVDTGRILIELMREAGQVIGYVSDAPETGRPLSRHQPIRMLLVGDRATLVLPRVGQLVSGDLPRDVHVVGQGDDESH